MRTGQPNNKPRRGAGKVLPKEPRDRSDPHLGPGGRGWWFWVWRSQRLPRCGCTVIDEDQSSLTPLISIEKYQQARQLIEKAGVGDFEGAKPESLVAKAEAALGLAFPPSYRRFLAELGCGDVNGLEVFGLINDKFENSTVPNGIWLTLRERQDIDLNPAYVLIGEGGDGTYYSLDTRLAGKDGEAPVVRLSVDGKQSEKVAESFGEYFLEAVRNVV